MTRVRVCFLWHFHQPDYREGGTGRARLPWVRLHGVKDYVGMARLLEEHPHMKVTANFSPVLLDQLEGFVSGADDAPLRDLRLFPGGVPPERARQIRAGLFYCPGERFIEPVPRFRALYAKHGRREEFSRADDLDLAVLYSLAWIHPVEVAADPFLKGLQEKGAGFTEEERERLLTLHRSVAAQAIPRWKKLLERGQVEVSTSPYAHPILPLLLDMSSLREARPELPLPEQSEHFPDDARWHLEEARRRSHSVWGTTPAGLWPSEGGVSEETARLAESCGFEWMATDEEILRRSGGGNLHQVYRSGALSLLFRDRTLSDLIGFSYSRRNSREAVEDFFGRLAKIPDGSTVLVALDGENPWEHYAGGGVEFLRRLYGGFAESDRYVVSTCSEAVQEENPAPLKRLAAGSWIQGDFSVWAGHEEDRKGWSLLSRVRNLLPPMEKLTAEARKSLAAAEGSDWFWWYGDEFSTQQGSDFDELFRGHLRQACQASGVEPPEGLSRRIKGISGSGTKVIRSISPVRIDGRRSDYFEWGGVEGIPVDSGSMGGGGGGARTLFVGCSRELLFLRVDFDPGTEASRLLEHGKLLLRVVRPAPRTLSLWPPAEGVTSVGAEILEVSVPRALLGTGGAEIEFFLEYVSKERGTWSWPARESLTLILSSAEFESGEWHV